MRAELMHAVDEIKREDVVFVVAGDCRLLFDDEPPRPLRLIRLRFQVRLHRPVKPGRSFTPPPLCPHARPCPRPIAFWTQAAGPARPSIFFGAARAALGRLLGGRSGLGGALVKRAAVAFSNGLVATGNVGHTALVALDAVVAAPDALAGLGSLDDFSTASSWLSSTNARPERTAANSRTLTLVELAPSVRKLRRLNRGGVSPD